MYLLPFMAALAAGARRAHAITGLRSTKLNGAWVFTAFLLTVLIGWRFEVGGDWFNYFRYLDGVWGLSLGDVLLQDDPAYQLLNWISLRFGWGIFGVNVVSGAIFSVGLAVFCRSLSRPWLALAVAIPYMVTVVAMGYSRQGIALGLAMLGLVALGRKSTRRFVFWVVLGATFHKSAVLLLPISALATTRNRWWTAAWVGVVAAASYVVLLQDSAEALYANYVEAQYQSQGALIRLLMNAVPAAILLLWRKRFRFAPAEAQLWRWFAIISLGLLVLVIVSPATTAVDRIALYLLPLQLMVFSQFPEVLGKRGRRNEALVLLVLLYYGAVQFVWLNFATHAFAWLPYQNALFL